ncbi:hypothetical protein BH10ACI1_BH10ACI1_06720 [soil metagenome]
MKVLAPNTLLQNRYLVVHLIGKGGMGEVYLAVDQRLGSAVALKRTFFAENETLGNAFEREARILGRLRHPVLPKVSDHFIENDNQYLIMEHISGDDLAKRLELTQKPFPLSWVLFWGDQLLDALSYLHSHEPPIIHRDIKPQNLKLTDENNIILLDFGLSKSSIGDSRLSNPINSNASGSVVGYTPHYAPMEQIRGTGTNPRSDIYSLSTTIYQLLTNLVPPDALTRADSLLNGSPDPVQPINELNKEVSKSVSDVIIKGMAVSQDLRYANAREMQKELRDAYAQMQKDMAAQTIALSASDPVGSAVSDAPASVVPLVSGQSQVETFIDNAPKNNPAMEVPAFTSQPQNQPPNFDATLQYDGESQAFPEKQSHVKTEVFSGGIFSDGTESESVAAETYSPDSTMPVTSFEELKSENDSAANSFTPSEENSEEAVPATALYMPTGDYPAAQNLKQSPNFTASESYSSTPDSTASEAHSSAAPYQADQFNSQPSHAAAAASTATGAIPAVQPQKKSGGGKVLAIVGVLGLLLFLGIGAAGLGYWYLYGGGATKTETNPTPTPADSVSPTPTPQEILVDNNSQTNSGGTADSNSNNSTELTHSNSETNSTTVTTKTPVTTTTATPKTQTTQTTQTTRVTPTPRKTDTSTAGTTKVTPVKTPKKDDSTKILQ